MERVCSSENSFFDCKIIEHSSSGAFLMLVALYYYTHDEMDENRYAFSIFVWVLALGAGTIIGLQTAAFNYIISKVLLASNNDLN